MSAARSLIAFLGLILCAPHPGADLTTIDRTIAKEPKYESKPRYCLLVFGPDAKTRVWLVIDGKVLYVDRDGNGDLTGPDERVVAKDGVFRVGEIKDVATGTTHKDVTVSVDSPVDGTSEVRPFEVNARIRGKYMCFVIADPGDRPGAAPVVHLDGPLQIRLNNEGLAFERGKDSRLSIYRSPTPGQSRVEHPPGRCRQLRFRPETSQKIADEILRSYGSRLDRLCGRPGAGLWPGFSTGASWRRVEADETGT